METLRTYGDTLAKRHLAEVETLRTYGDTLAKQLGGSGNFKVFEGKGALWIKDIELVQAPLPAAR